MTYLKIGFIGLTEVFKGNPNRNVLPFLVEARQYENHLLLFHSVQHHQGGDCIAFTLALSNLEKQLQNIEQADATIFYPSKPSELMKEANKNLQFLEAVVDEPSSAKLKDSMDEDKKLPPSSASIRQHFEDIII